MAVTALGASHFKASQLSSKRQVKYDLSEILCVGLLLGRAAVTGHSIHSPITVSNISLSFSHSCDYVPKEWATGSNLIEVIFDDF